MSRRAPLPAWALKRNADREAERQERLRSRLPLVGLGTQDPDAVAAWSKSLVKAIYGVGGTYCLWCSHKAGRSAFPYDTEPDTECCACGRPVSEAARKGA